MAVGTPIGGRKVPKDGDGDGFYSPAPGAPDKTPVPVAAVTKSVRRYKKAKKRNKSLNDILKFLELDPGKTPAEKKRFRLKAKKFGWGAPSKAKDKKPESATSPNEVRRMIFQAQGYDGLPELVDLDDMPESERFYRGLEAKTEEEHAGYVNAFKNGDYFIGGGVYGSGTYTSSDQQLAAVYSAVDETDGGVERPDLLITMQLNPNALVLDYRDLEAIRRNIEDQIGERGDLTTEVRRGLADQIRNPGTLATLLGYDAISVPSQNTPTMLVLNRTALRVAK